MLTHFGAIHLLRGLPSQEEDSTISSITLKLNPSVYNFSPNHYSMKSLSKTYIFDKRNISHFLQSPPVISNSYNRQELHHPTWNTPLSIQSSATHSWLTNNTWICFKASYKNNTWFITSRLLNLHNIYVYHNVSNRYKGRLTTQKSQRLSKR